MVRDIKQLNFDSFEKFKEKNFRAYKTVIFPPNQQDRSLGVCTCVSFYKNFKCVHIVGLAIQTKNLTIDRSVKEKAKEEYEASIPLPGKKRSVGRPKRVTPALQKD